MADAKRSSGASGKAASVKGAPNAADLSKAIGSIIHVSTTLQSHTLEGTLYAADPNLDIVAIREVQTTGSFHIVSISQINTFKIISPGPSGEAEQQLAAGKVDTEALKEREAKAIAAAKKAEANIGKGVSREAQELFDAISRTLPTRWNGVQIIVSDSVLIEPPYGLENMKAPRGKETALEHTKRVVGGFWAKKRGAASGTATPVGNGGGPPAKVPVPTIPRKGG